MRKDKRTAAIFGGLALAWVGVLFFFSGQSGAASGTLSLKLTRFLFGWRIERGANINTLHILVRKLAHMGVFAVEGFLLGSTLVRLMHRPKAMLISVVVCGLLATANELHQLTAVARSCSPIDMLIDTAGAMFGILFAVLVHWLFRRRPTRG